MNDDVSVIVEPIVNVDMSPMSSSEDETPVAGTSTRVPRAAAVRAKSATRAVATGDLGGGRRDGGESAPKVTKFVDKLYEMVDDPSCDDFVSWSEDGTAFTVHRPFDIRGSVLPNYYNHNNFSSFVRQLHVYGFRKKNQDEWQFAHPSFLQGRRDLLGEIRRRPPATKAKQQPLASPSQNQHSVEIGRYGQRDMVSEQLLRDKDILVKELIRMRQQQQDMAAELMEQRRKQERTEQTLRDMSEAFRQFVSMGNTGQSGKRSRVDTTLLPRSPQHRAIAWQPNSPPVVELDDASSGPSLTTGSASSPDPAAIAAQASTVPVSTLLTPRGSDAPQLQVDIMPEAAQGTPVFDLTDSPTQAIPGAETPDVTMDDNPLLTPNISSIDVADWLDAPAESPTVAMTPHTS